MAVNKVKINGEVKLDLTQDTVTPENLLSGATAHNAAGERISGAVAPVRYDVAQDLTSDQKNSGPGQHRRGVSWSGRQGACKPAAGNQFRENLHRHHRDCVGGE